MKTTTARSVAGILCLAVALVFAVGVSVGGSGTASAAQTGSIVVWGDNGVGQCNVPAPNTGFVAVAAGGSHSLGLKADGSIVAWGLGR